MFNFFNFLIEKEDYLFSQNVFLIFEGNILSVRIVIYSISFYLNEIFNPNSIHSSALFLSFISNSPRTFPSSFLFLHLPFLFPIFASFKEHFYFLFRARLNALDTTTLRYFYIDFLKVHYGARKTTPSIKT